MLTIALAKKIESLSMDEYRMVEAYVEDVVEGSRQRKKEATWEEMQTDLKQPEKQM